MSRWSGQQLACLVVLAASALVGPSGCGEEAPTAPQPDSYLKDYSAFDYFEYTRLVDLICIPDRGVRSMALTQAAPGRYTVSFRLVTRRYCGSGDTLVVETIAPRLLSVAEADSVKSCFESVEIHRGLGEACSFAPFVPLLARWDATVFGRFCDVDYLGSDQSSRLMSLVDFLLRGAPRMRAEQSSPNRPCCPDDKGTMWRVSLAPGDVW